MLMLAFCWRHNSDTCQVPRCPLQQIVGSLEASPRRPPATLRGSNRMLRVCHHMLAADEPSCSLLTACLSVCYSACVVLPYGVQRVIALFAVRFVLAMLPSWRIAVCLSGSSHHVSPSALLAVLLLACSSLPFCLSLTLRQLIVSQGILSAMRVSMCRHSAQHWKRTASMHGVLHCAMLIAGTGNARRPVCGLLYACHLVREGFMPCSV